MQRPLLFVTTLALSVAACEKQPAYIKVKVPAQSYASVRADPILPPFTAKGDTIQLRASMFYKDDSFMGQAKQVKWSSTDPSVASVGLDGLVEIVSSGDAKIKATTVGYEPDRSAELAIKAVIIDKVEIIPPAELGEEVAIHMGDTVQFTAKVLDDRGNVIPDAKVKWRTSDYAATVTPTGEVEGRSIGDTQVIAEAGDEHTRFVINVLDWKKEKKKRRR